ncbi:hypothetical protein [Arthrobacter sp. UYCu712]|uniref:hypothetical protein n=1 Tax=Arthrobacter sp. UYCu712 TaxID=3156340 RepID=UPI0033933EDB
MTTTPKLGQTCTVGNGKTRWEIIRIEADTTLHLSKVGGDGYTNRWAKPADLNNIKDRALAHTLGHVLLARQTAADAATALAEQIKRHAKPDSLRVLRDATVVSATRYIRIYAAHLAEMAQEGEEA